MVIEGDEYDQYFIAVEQTLMLECRDIATALFLLLASHYVFNLSYHTKCTDFLIFIQEKVAKIPSVTSADSDSKHKKRKEKSPVALSHTNGIARSYDSLKDVSSNHSDMD